MKSTWLQLIRTEYEEPYCVHLLFSASNGSFEGFLEYYCNASDLKDIGQALKTFPKKVPDAYSYEIGSTKPEDRFAYYFALRAFTIDNIGHCALQVEIDNNCQGPEGATCRFSIRIEPADLNRLANLLLRFAKLEHYELNWTLTGEGDSLKTKEEIDVE